MINKYKDKLFKLIIMIKKGYNNLLIRLLLFLNVLLFTFRLIIIIICFNTSLMSTSSIIISQIEEDEYFCALLEYILRLLQLLYEQR